MAKIVIGTLGVGNVQRKSKEGAEAQKKEYEGALYSFEGRPQPIEALYTLHAITKHERPDKLVVLLTQKAKEEQWPSLKEWIELYCSEEKIIDCDDMIVEVDISHGANQSEAWTIFRKISQKIPPDSEVVLDITLGLRSIPVLMLSAVRYLQHANNIKLSKIYYAAFDNRQNDITPMYSLDAFISLLDWATAVEVFNRTGSSVLLADLLGKQHTEIRFPNGNRVVEALRKLSLSLDLIRSQSVLIASSELVRHVKTARRAQVSPQDEPIFQLMEAVAREFEPLALGTPRKNIASFLDKTLQLIEWYKKRNRYTEAVLLAREWCISWIMNRQNCTPEQIFDAKVRASFSKNMDKYRKLIPFWEDLRNLRNHLAHAQIHEKAESGMKSSQRRTRQEKLGTEIEKVLTKVIRLRDQL